MKNTIVFLFFFLCVIASCLGDNPYQTPLAVYAVGDRFLYSANGALASTQTVLLSRVGSVNPSTIVKTITTITSLGSVSTVTHNISVGQLGVFNLTIPLLSKGAGRMYGNIWYWNSEVGSRTAPLAPLPLANTTVFRIDYTDSGIVGSETTTDILGVLLSFTREELSYISAASYNALKLALGIPTPVVSIGGGNQ